MNKKAFSLIEVLIATLILSISILVLSVALKQFFTYKNKLSNYQLLYITTLSLIDKISSQSLLNKRSSQGKLNGLSYKYKATIVEKKTNALNYLSDNSENDFKLGNFEIILFKVELWVENKKFEFFKTEYNKLSVNTPL